MIFIYSGGDGSSVGDAGASVPYQWFVHAHAHATPSRSNQFAHTHTHTLHPYRVEHYHSCAVKILSRELQFNLMIHKSSTNGEKRDGENTSDSMVKDTHYTRISLNFIKSSFNCIFLSLVFSLSRLDDSSYEDELSFFSFFFIPLPLFFLSERAFNLHVNLCLPLALIFDAAQSFQMSPLTGSGECLHNPLVCHPV